MSLLNDFLKSARSGLNQDQTITIVMGNEAADLDSMASALTYAYFLKERKLSGNPVPLINIPSGDFKLRTEAVFLFKEAGINPQNLISVEDIDLDTLNNKGNLKIVLTDHNKLGSHQEKYKDAVIEILDHHTDEGEYFKNVKTDIRPVGSVCTLVAERYLAEGPGLLNESVGTLLLGTILLDTVDLDPEAGRVKPEDEKAAFALIKKLDLNRKDLFNKLQFEKFNVSSLGSYDLLRKDYKEWDLGGKRCGIGSALLPVSEWLKKDADIVESFERYRKERKLDVLISMNAFTKPSFTRNLIVYVPDTMLRKKLIDFIEGSDLGLEKIDSSAVKNNALLNVYNQKNLGISRKKLQPLLKGFFE